MIKLRLLVTQDSLESNSDTEWFILEIKQTALN